MKKVLLYIILFCTSNLYSQDEFYKCKNFWKESFNLLGNPDTIFAAVDYTGNFSSAPKVRKSKIEEKQGRLIVYVFKKNNEWYSAIAVITTKKYKHYWYQSGNDIFPFSMRDSLICNLFNTCYNELAAMVEQTKVQRGEHGGRYIQLYIKNGNSILEVPFYQPPGRGDIKGLYGGPFNSIFSLYSLGLSNSCTLYMPFEGKCYKTKNE